MIYRTLYHLDNNDNIRIWYMEREGSQYRTHAGIRDGKIVTSDWKQASEKNVGKTNATTPEQQADSEIESIYQKKLDRKYAETPETAQKSNFVQPMLAATFDEKKTLKGAKTWYAQPKFDGLRCVIDDKGGTSRSGKPFVTVTHIVDVLDELCQEFNVTFDGELYNHEYKDDFEKLVSLVKKTKISTLTDEERAEIAAKVEFHVYDVIMWDHLDATYEERMAFLNGLFSTRIPADSMVKQCLSIKLVNPTMEQVQELHDKFFEAGYEGLMLRDALSVYLFKRAKGLVKYKNFDEAEFKILKIIEGTGNWAGAAKSVELDVPQNKTTSEAGVTGTYLRNVEVLQNADEYTEATTLFQGFTKEGKLRFGRVKAFHKGERDY